MTNEQIVWNFLKEKIGNEYGVAGLMGNLYAESGLIPTNMENAYESKLGYTDATYTAAVDNGTYTKFSSDAVGYGLAQWTYSTRKKALLAYAKQKGVSIGELNIQLEYLYKELSESYSGVLQTLKSATSVQSASNKVLTDFERPANQSDSVKTTRAKYGQNYYDKYTKEETTMEYTVENLLKIAQNEIGYYEKASNSNLDSKTANAGSNNWTKYARDLAAAGYYNGNKNGYPWCDCFVDWCFYQLADKDATKAQYLICQTGDLGAAVNYSAGYYKNAGRYYTSGPKAGDQIFFNSNGSMTHTGIVESVTSTYVNTIEGNTSNMVARRSYRIGASNISGYGRPRYDGDGNLTAATGATSGVVTGGVPSDGTPSTSTSTTTTTTNTAQIKQFQTWMNKTISAGLVVDGAFGPKSKKAAVKILQNYLNTKYKAGLKVDGDYGKLSQAAVVKAKINITKGSSEKTLVYLVQGMLYANGYSPTGFDGVFGGGTFAALKKYQSAKGLTADGVAGPNTLNKMFG